MGKNKLKRFAEMKSFDNVVQPELSEILNIDYHLKGKWCSSFFANENPLVLELACGKGEYTIKMAQKNHEINYIGIDRKGARIWKGACLAIENQIKNAAFLRIRIENIASCFARNEVSQIWITFPDPHLNKSGEKHRLTSPHFQHLYQSFLKPEGSVCLKTDSDELYHYTLDIIHEQGFILVRNYENVYNENLSDEILSIKTFYEEQHLASGKTIKFIEWKYR